MRHFMFPGREILHALSFLSVQLAFLRHADRVKIGCMTGGLGALCASDHDNVWKTASHYAYMQMLKYAKGTSMRTAVESDTYDMPGYAIDDTSQYTGKEGVNYIDSASAWDKENNTLTVFAINRNENESYGLNVDIKGFEGYTNVEHFETFCTDDELDKVSSVDNQEMFLPKKNTTGELKDGVYSVSVKPLSWNVFVFKK